MHEPAHPHHLEPFVRKEEHFTGEKTQDASISSEFYQSKILTNGRLRLR